ncbi:MAG: DUF3099 domain-containing protein [Geodermatophilaceae bacterium]|nr:DUF3099 domain-containing protein [Geodermatophilaceae bacterium]MDQ3477382.1 DUF3099 domain-containing protein [Actinomycetota bacterium]
MNRGREGDEPVLITEAAPSLLEQHDARKRRYIITMAVRAVCLILATVFYQILWVMAFFAILAIILPGIAVLVANDRPPKKARNAHRFRGDQTAVSGSAPLPRTAIAPNRIIDVD